MRFKVAKDAQIFCDGLSGKPVYQTNGLDEGSSNNTGTASHRSIAGELVSGTRDLLGQNPFQSPGTMPCSTASRFRVTAAGPAFSALVGLPEQGVTSSNRSDWFPQGCLLFVKTVHSETSRTTLHKLFAQGFSGVGGSDPIDYVDYQKGLNSCQCYIRLRSNTDTETLHNHLTASHLSQNHALDDKGDSSPKEGSIQAEIITGKKEELYWEKIPEKVRLAMLEATGRCDNGEVQAERSKKKRREWATNLRLLDLKPEQ